MHILTTATYTKQLLPSPGIGVFGHWSHLLSDYSIQVFLDTSAIQYEESMAAMEKGHRIGDQQGKKCHN